MYVEIVRPESHREFTADLPPMGAFLNPNQLMNSYASRELARGKGQTPSYAPYIGADLPDAPWPVFSAGHTTPLANWESNKQA